MRSSILIAPLMSGLALAGSIVKRDAATVVADLQAIQSQIATFQGQIGMLSDTGDNTPLLIAIQTQSGQVKAALDKATTDINASANFNDQESLNVGLEALKLPDATEALINLLIQKKPAFVRGLAGQDVTGLVLSQLQDQKASATALGNALPTKLTPTFAGQAPAVIQRINAAFDKGIAAYQPGGAGGSSSAAPPASSSAVVPPPASSSAVVPPPVSSSAVVSPPASSSAVVPPPVSSSAVVPPPVSSSAVVPPPVSSSAVVPPPVSSSAPAPGSSCPPAGPGATVTITAPGATVTAPGATTTKTATVTVTQGGNGGGATKTVTKTVTKTKWWFTITYGGPRPTAGAGGYPVRGGY